MRSKISKKILSVTSQETKDKVNDYANKLVLSGVGNCADGKLTQCMMGRDSECNHPKCPITEEDMKNGKYCNLPLYDYRQ